MLALRLLTILTLIPAVLAQAQDDRPHLLACGSMAFSGKTLCVCGNFPDSSRGSLLLDGRPLGNPVSATRGSLTFVVPENLEPGLHVIGGIPDAGFSPSDAVVTTVLQLVPEIDQAALLTGQRTRARFVVRGVTAPLQLRITNRTPEVVSIEGGVEQVVRTSGGANNVVQRDVRAVARGNFTIDVELAAAACPCAEPESTSRAGSVPAPPGPPAAPESQDPRGFIVARIAALIPLAPAGAMAATAQGLATTFGLTVAELTPLPTSNDGLVVFTVPAALDVPTVVAALNADPRVRFAEPDLIFETAGAAPAQIGVNGESDYGKRLIGLERLDSSLNGRDVPVAVIDTGVDANHPALSSRLSLKADVTATSYRSGIHGTLVAGIIAGLASRTKLLSIQACLPHSEQAIGARCSTVTLAKAIDLAIQKKARIINLSLGGPSSRIVERSIQQAVSRGVIVVVAAGNGGQNATPSFPAVMDSVIAVTAVDVTRSLYRYATHGSFIDLAAPGVDIRSAAPGGGALIFSGTSAAAPHVSALIALMFQESTAQTPVSIQQALERAAQDLGPRGKDPDFGSGLVDACRSIEQLKSALKRCQ